MSTKDKSDSEDMEKFCWGAEEEIQLFSALKKLKPVGINKYFFMACISDRLSSALKRDISSDQIWTHLKSLYNLTALDALEPLPFPNDECEFSLPETEFSAFISKKKIEIENETVKTEVVKQPAEVVVAQKINKTPVTPTVNQKQVQPPKELIEKKVIAKIIASDTPKRPPKRTRGSMSLESNSPSTTPPPTQANKRRRI